LLELFIPKRENANLMRGRRVARQPAEIPIPTSTVVQIATPTVLSAEFRLRQHTELQITFTINSHKKSPSLPSKLSSKLPIYGNLTIVAVLPTAAKLKIPATNLFCLVDISKPLTTKIGKIPNVQSAMTFNPDTAYVNPMMTEGLMQCFWFGSRDHQSETG
jgi:hypothetical protein